MLQKLQKFLNRARGGEGEGGGGGGGGGGEGEGEAHRGGVNPPPAAAALGGAAAGSGLAPRTNSLTLARAVECCLCRDPKQRGLYCDNTPNNARHFTCDECLCAQVQQCLPRLRNNEYRITCPCKTGAANACQSSHFEDRSIIRALRGNEEVLASYYDALRAAVVNSQQERGGRGRGGGEEEEKEGDQQRNADVVLDRVWNIVAEELNMVCPNRACSAVLDPAPEACSAMSCANCHQNFCYLCFVITASNEANHQHVRECPDNPRRPDMFVNNAKGPGHKKIHLSKLRVALLEYFGLNWRLNAHISNALAHGRVAPLLTSHDVPIAAAEVLEGNDAQDEALRARFGHPAARLPVEGAAAAAAAGSFPLIETFTDMARGVETLVSRLCELHFRAIDSCQGLIDRIYEENWKAGAAAGFAFICLALPILCYAAFGGKKTTHNLLVRNFHLPRVFFCGLVFAFLTVILSNFLFILNFAYEFRLRLRRTLRRFPRFVAYTSFAFCLYFMAWLGSNSAASFVSFERLFGRGLISWLLSSLVSYLLRLAVFVMLNPFLVAAFEEVVLPNGVFVPLSHFVDREQLVEHTCKGIVSASSRLLAATTGFELAEVQYIVCWYVMAQKQALNQLHVADPLRQCTHVEFGLSVVLSMLSLGFMHWLLASCLTNALDIDLGTMTSYLSFQFIGRVVAFVFSVFCFYNFCCGVYFLFRGYAHVYKRLLRTQRNDEQNAALAARLGNTIAGLAKDAEILLQKPQVRIISCLLLLYVSVHHAPLFYNRTLLYSPWLGGRCTEFDVGFYTYRLNCSFELANGRSKDAKKINFLSGNTTIDTCVEKRVSNLAYFAAALPNNEATSFADIAIALDVSRVPFSLFRSRKAVLTRVCKECSVHADKASTGKLVSVCRMLDNSTISASTVSATSTNEEVVAAKKSAPIIAKVVEEEKEEEKPSHTKSFKYLSVVVMMPAKAVTWARSLVAATVAKDTFHVSIISFCIYRVFAIFYRFWHMNGVFGPKEWSWTLASFSLWDLASLALMIFTKFGKDVSILMSLAFWGIRIVPVFRHASRAIDNLYFLLTTMTPLFEFESIFLLAHKANVEMALLHLFGLVCGVLVGVVWKEQDIDIVYLLPTMNSYYQQ